MTLAYVHTILFILTTIISRKKARLLHGDSTACNADALCLYSGSLTVSLHFASFDYVHCVSKNIPNIFDYNLKKNY